MNKHENLNELFIDIATSIRNKTKDVNSIKADDFPDVIDSISTGITPSGTLPIIQNGTYDVTNYASADVNIPSSGANMFLATSVSANTLVFEGTSGYTNFSIFFIADTGYAAASQVYGIYTYSHNDNYYRAVYYMAYGGAKFNFTRNTKPDEVVRSGDNFTISSTYYNLGLSWITNTTQGKYIGFFW